MKTVTYVTDTRLTARKCTSQQIEILHVVLFFPTSQVTEWLAFLLCGAEGWIQTRVIL